VSTTTVYRTARTPHRCDTCDHTPSLRGVLTIAPGHRYLRHVAFPGGPSGEVNQSDRPYALNECVGCASDRDPSVVVVKAEACGMYCCSHVPCARPLRHGGDHSCRRCALGGAQ